MNIFFDDKIVVKKNIITKYIFPTELKIINIKKLKAQRGTKLKKSKWDNT